MLQQEEQQRKSWEMKAVASEKQLEQLQVRQALAGPRWLVARGQLAEAKQEPGLCQMFSLSSCLGCFISVWFWSFSRKSACRRVDGERESSRGEPSPAVCWVWDLRWSFF